MSTRRHQPFATIRVEGVILPPDLLQGVAAEDKDLGGLKPTDYGLAKTERINEAVSRSWTRLTGLWESFKEARTGNLEFTQTAGLTRDRWLLPLFQELGYGRLQRHTYEIDGKTYPISHLWGSTPIHLLGADTDLDRRTARVAGAATASPHSLVQELLNRQDDYLWAFLSNGLTLRVLRDNVSLSRQAYVDFDLEAIFEGEVYADFRLLWMVCHATRVEAERPEDCILEKWSRTAAERGTRALDSLRQGVEGALKHLGSGFLKHPNNDALRESLRSGELSTDDYFRQILRLVYRLLFLFVAEDRDLLMDPKAPREARARYLDHYSTARLRTLAARRRPGRHADLWEGLKAVMEALWGEGSESIALPALGSFLWSPEAMPDLMASSLHNRSLLDAVRSLAYVREHSALRAVDYKNLGAEELGSVYESLLELHPKLHLDEAVFELGVAVGHERKTTGSYYTPDSLVQCLLDTALDPVVEEAVKGKRGTEAEQAILDLKICDPAVGSGHFLIAAAHRLAKRLAAIRTEDEEPAPEATRTALRDVIGRCLYGVDVNPMSAELCKVALWMEAVEPGRPLSFLDHHIRVGNSLLGTTPELIAAGLPDDAFKAIEGDDKRACSDLRKRNKKERLGQRDMLYLMTAEPAIHYDPIANRLRAIDRAPDRSIEEVNRKSQDFREFINSEDYRHAKLVADSWCSVFFAKKTVSMSPGVLTTDAIRRLEADATALEGNRRKQVEELADRHQFFQWHLSFPEVFDRGGFDCVLGNPPWERIKIQQEEFFATRAPEIAKAKNAAARRKLISQLPETNPSLAKEWSEALRVASAKSAFLRLSGRYPLGGLGDVNTYAVFADFFRQSVNEMGAAALLVPNGLVTGFTYRGFLKHLLDTKTLACFYGFENEDKIFPDVHNETKFGILSMTGEGRPVEKPWFTAHIRQPHQIHDENYRYSLSAEQIKAINPNTQNIPTFRLAADAEITASIHSIAPPLVLKEEEREISNPWSVKFKRMFDMTNDADLFLDNIEVEQQHRSREGMLTTLEDGRKVYPLYEGKMFWLFDHRYGTYRGQTQKQANKGVLPRVEGIDHNLPAFTIQPRYWIEKSHVERQMRDNRNREWFIAWRDVGPTERTLITTAIPMTGVGNKAPLLLSTVKPENASALLGVLSSLVLDYDIRQRSNTLNYFAIEQLAVLTPEHLDIYRPWLGSSATRWLSERVLELCYSSYELEPFARDLGCKCGPFRWFPERRAHIQAEIDAAVLHLYSLTREQAGCLLDSFFVLKKYEERDHGEFKTKRLVLEVFDEMDQAKTDATRYQTRLDPPPADPSCCHTESPRPGWAKPPGRKTTAYTGIPESIAAEPDLELKSQPANPKPDPKAPPATTRTTAQPTTGDHLTQALDFLRTNHGPHSRADILTALNLTSADWPSLREALDTNANIRTTGRKRGTRYSWGGGVE